MWDLPGPGIKPTSPMLAGEFFPVQLPEKPCDENFYDLFSQQLSNIQCRIFNDNTPKLLHIHSKASH